MVLVTGGTGLVGSHLLWELISRGEKVRALYRSKKSLDAVKNLFKYKELDLEEKGFYDTIEWFQADLTNIPSLERAFSGVHYVYHCAALVSFDPDRFKELQKVNMEGTANLVNLSLEYDVEKFCHVSSVGALGRAQKGPTSEQNFWVPHKNNSVYSITKFASESEVWRGTQEGLHAVIVNPVIILGEGFYSKGSGSFFNYVGKQSRYSVPGSNDFVDVLDVVNIMILLVEKSIKNERFILSAGHLKYNKLFTQIAQHLNVKPPKLMLKRWQMNMARVLDYLSHVLFRTERTLFRNTVESSFKKTRFDSTKLKNELNYKYIPLEETIKRVSAHYATHRN